MAARNQFHFHAGVVQRSKGQSAVAGSAYRSGQNLENDLTGERHDYTKKKDIVHAEIIAPENAPEWAKDRGQLWNQAEAAETRVNSQTARTFDMSLPKELTAEQRLEYARQYCKEQFTDKGMVADFAIHKPAKDNDNHHMHVMTTMREIGPEGFGAKNREWNNKAQLESWREEWANYSNRALEKAGKEPTFDHRSLEAQGIDREPSVHLGPTAKKMERDGRASDRGDLNRGIKDLNETRAEGKRLDKKAEVYRESAGREQEKDAKEKAQEQSRETPEARKERLKAAAQAEKEQASKERKQAEKKPEKSATERLKQQQKSNKGKGWGFER